MSVRRSISSADKTEEGIDTAPATKHATVIEPLSGIFDSFCSPLVPWQSATSDSSAPAGPCKSACMRAVIVSHSATHALAIAGAIASQASRNDNRMRLITEDKIAMERPTLNTLR